MKKIIIFTFILFIAGCATIRDYAFLITDSRELSVLQKEMVDVREIYEQCKIAVIQMRDENQITDEVWADLIEVDESLQAAYRIIQSGQNTKAGILLAENAMNLLLPIAQTHIKNKNLNTDLNIFFELLKYRKTTLQK